MPAAGKVPQIAAEVSRLYQKRTVHTTVLSWKVPDYEKLKIGVVYYQKYEKIDLECRFRMLKTGESKLSLTVTSPGIAPNIVAEFLIVDDFQHTSVSKPARKLRDGAYEALFNTWEFEYPESGYLRQGVLSLAFKYASDAFERYRGDEYGETPDTHADLDQLFCDLKHMYLESIFPDFQVHVGEYVFRTHKFILASRSDYFKNIIKADKSLTGHQLIGDLFYPGILHEVFLYMYSGELKELSLECMQQVYRTALYFGMALLCTRCLQYFRTRISLENCRDIFEYAMKHQLIVLKKQILKDWGKNFLGIKIPHVVADKGYGIKASEYL